MSPVTAAPLSEAFRSTKGRGRQIQCPKVLVHRQEASALQRLWEGIRAPHGSVSFLPKYRRFYFISNQNIDFNLHCFKNLPPTWTAEFNDFWSAVFIYYEDTYIMSITQFIQKRFQLIHPIRQPGVQKHRVPQGTAKGFLAYINDRRMDKGQFLAEDYLCHAPWQEFYVTNDMWLNSGFNLEENPSSACSCPSEPTLNRDSLDFCSSKNTDQISQHC